MRSLFTNLQKGVSIGKSVNGKNLLKFSTSSRFTLNRNLAVMSLNNLLCDRQGHPALVGQASEKQQTYDLSLFELEAIKSSIE